MVECSWINFLHFALFLGFLALSGLALMDVLSGETTINVSRVKHEYITTFPSFTICTRHELNSTQLKNGTLNQFPLEMELQINATVWNPKEQQINMMNESQFMNFFEGARYVQCKPYDPFDDDKYDNNSDMLPFCVPCLVFNIASIKVKKVQRGHIGMKAYPSNDQERVDIIITFHDHMQSLMLLQGFDWSHSLWFEFRPEVNWGIFHNVQLTERNLISNCTQNEDFNIDKEMMEIISQNINCSLPWDPFNATELDECTEEKDYEKYLTAIYHHQKDFTKMEEKCKVNSWKALPTSENSQKGNTSIFYGINLNKKDGISIENEVKVYTFPYFIGTFGGYLGLFLGGSILGYLQMISDFFTSRTP